MDARDLLKSALDLAKPAVETACSLIDSLLGQPCRVAGGMLDDQIYAWRWKNRIRIANRALQTMKKNDIAARVLPAGFLLPLLEAAGNVEDETLQDMWARILASAAQSDDHQSPMFVETLRRMSPFDALVFKRVLSARPERHGIVTFHLIEGDRAVAASLVRLEVLGLAREDDVLPQGAPANVLPVSLLPLGQQLRAALEVGDAANPT